MIPEPQRVELKSADFEFGNGWHIETGPSVGAGDVAVESLSEQLKERSGLRLETHGAGKAIELSIQPGAVQASAPVASQAYRLLLSESRIRIIANAAPGLFYGVETLVQLVKPEARQMVAARRRDRGLAQRAAPGSLLG